MEAWIQKVGISPGIDYMASGIKLDQRRGQMAGVQVSVDDVLSIQQQYVVLAIDTDTAQAPKHPAVGQWLRPGPIDFIPRRTTLGS
jgi:hypothetical protein